MESSKYHGEVEVPEWFKVGVKFKSEWVKNMDIEVLSFDAVKNLLHVKLVPDSNAESYRQAWTEDGWNLRHTLSAFKSTEYKLI